MTLNDFVTNSYLLATGKATPPLAGTPKYQKLVILANRFSQKWANEADVTWTSLRQIFDVGPVTATDTYPLDDSFGRISDQEGDFVRIFHTDGIGETDYTVVPISKLYTGEAMRQHGDGNLCAISGSNLMFQRAFTSSDAQYGGSIEMPGSVIPDTLVNPNDIIQVDDPNWLVEICAAEYVRTDLTRQAQYPNLIAMANDTMNSMISINDTQGEYVYQDAWRPLGDTWS